MADADNAISPAVNKYFCGCKMLFCWFHVIMNLKKKYHYVMKPLRTYLKHDLKWIQYRNNETLFKTSVALLFQKY